MNEEKRVGQSASRNINNLTPREFENLTFDLMQATGMVHLVWRTPGSDGGRDIEGIYLSQDASGQIDQQKWYVECKRYSTAIDWPTLWSKIAYADNEGADFLLLVTNSNPSPNCESQIEKWNARRVRPTIRVWRGYDIDRVLKLHAPVALKYGLIEVNAVSSGSFAGIVVEMMKFVQSAYSAQGVGGDAQLSLEAAAALSELLALRMENLTRYGKVVEQRSRGQISCYEWMGGCDKLNDFEEVSVRAIAATLRHVTVSRLLRATVSDVGVVLSPTDCRCPLREAGRRALAQVAVWTPCQVSFESAESNNIVLLKGR